jgi:hypothetical protein
MLGKNQQLRQKHLNDAEETAARLLSVLKHQSRRMFRMSRPPSTPNSSESDDDDMASRAEAYVMDQGLPEVPLEIHDFFPVEWKQRGLNHRLWWEDMNRFVVSDQAPFHAMGEVEGSDRMEMISVMNKPVLTRRLHHRMSHDNVRIQAMEPKDDVELNRASAEFDGFLKYLASLNERKWLHSKHHTELVCLLDQIDLVACARGLRDIAEWTEVFSWIAGQVSPMLQLRDPASLKVLSAAACNSMILQTFSQIVQAFTAEVEVSLQNFELPPEAESDVKGDTLQKARASFTKRCKKPFHTVRGLTHQTVTQILGPVGIISVNQVLFWDLQANAPLIAQDDPHPGVTLQEMLDDQQGPFWTTVNHLRRAYAECFHDQGLNTLDLFRRIEPLIDAPLQNPMGQLFCSGHGIWLNDHVVNQIHRIGDPERARVALRRLLPPVTLRDVLEPPSRRVGVDWLVLCGRMVERPWTGPQMMRSNYLVNRQDGNPCDRPQRQVLRSRVPSRPQSLSRVPGRASRIVIMRRRHKRGRDTIALYNWTIRLVAPMGLSQVPPARPAHDDDDQTRATNRRLMKALIKKQIPGMPGAYVAGRGYAGAMPRQQRRWLTLSQINEL